MRYCLFLFALFCLSLSSCAEDTPTSSEPSASKELVAGDIHLKQVRAKDLVQRIREEKGKVVVVDFWATTCPVCLKEFPKLLKLQKHFGKDKITCFSVTVDPPNRTKAAFEFLKRNQSKVPNFQIDTADDQMRVHWNFNVIPSIFVYDQNGDKMLQANYYGDVIETVETLLKTGDEDPTPDASS